MLNKLLITKTSSFEEVRQTIGELREKKGKERETLKLVKESLDFGHSFVVNLFFEESLTYQHLKSVSDMEKAVLKAKFYIDKYKLIDLKPRLFTFLGKVEDLKGNYKKAVSYYKRSLLVHKKSGKSFEVLGHLSYSLIMEGHYGKGYKLAKDTYHEFFNSTKGKELKKKDYATWAIWMSGITIRVVNALIDKNVRFNIDEIKEWVLETEKYIDIKNKFSYRKAEVKELWTKLQNYKKV